MLGVIFSLMVNFLVVAYSGIHCDCGYGGLCLDVPRAVMTNCSYSQAVSAGFYEADGHTIVDHCRRRPCVAGECVRTFGGFFCRCPADRIGHRCEMLRSGQWYEDFISKEDLYIHFQVQPDLVGTNSFTVVYESRGNSWLSADRISVWPIITVSDGRVYYPNHHFVPSNVKESCINHATSNPYIFDLRVCELLPSGTVDAFTFDVVESYTLGMKGPNVLEIPGLGQVGGKHVVNVRVRLRLDGEFIDIYDQNYTIFNYYDRAPYRCLIAHTFHGCSSDYRKPRMISRSDPLSFLVNNKKVQCDGVLVIRTEWRSQKIVEPADLSENMTGYNIPTYILGSKNKYYIYRPPFYFGRGKIMVEYAYTLRGTPPNRGSGQEFQKIGRCFVIIRAGRPFLATRGGTFRTMSCLNAFALPIESLNPNFIGSDFVIHVWCNVSSDRDCDRKKLTVPILTKVTKPECDSFYKFTLEVSYASTVTADETIMVNTIIHFIERTEALAVTCLKNCFPHIIPYERSILLATSTPYSPSPVKWEVKNEGAIVSQRYGEVLAFSPLTASRIIRLNGIDMLTPGKRVSEGSFTVYEDGSGLISSLNTTCDHIAEDLARGFDGGVHFNNTIEAVNLYPRSSDLYRFQPVSILVYEENLKMKDELLLAVSQYEGQLIDIKPDWNTLRICIKDIWRTQYCDQFNITVKYKDPNSRLVKFESLLQQWQDYDLAGLVSQSIIFFAQSLTAESDKYLSWTTSLADRRTIVDIMLKFDIIAQNGAKKVFFITSMMCYSNKGNKAEGLLEFKDETLQTSLEIIEWMKLRVTTLELLNVVIDTYLEWMKKFGTYLERHLLGSQTRLILRTWSLAYHQEYTFHDILRGVRNSTQRYFRGEVLFYSYLNDNLLYELLDTITRLLAMRARLYNGIHFLGEENVLSYYVRTSYVGILACLNKSNGNNDVADQFSDYIFEPVKPKQNWVKLISIEFPPTPQGWEDKEFVFAATAVKTSVSLYEDAGYEGNPMVNLYLANRENEPIEELNEGFNITIPYLKGNEIGSYTPESKTIGYLRKPLDQEEPSKYLYLASVNLPNHLRSWRLKIILDTGVTIKAVANVSQVPEYEDVDQAPELPVYTDGLRYSVLDIYPVKGRRLIPSKIYLAILPGKLPNPTVPSPIRLQYSLYFCKSYNYEDQEPILCEGLYQPLTLKQQYFNCTCLNFGLLYTVKTHIKDNGILVRALDLEIPVTFNWSATIVVGLAAIVMALVMAFAFWKDRRRYGESLIYLEDNYIKDSHLLIVAVFTSQRCSAGTTSKVAIKVEGSNSSSRVHLLHSSKRRTFRAGQDDWFVMTTYEPLGKLYRVQLWVDVRSRDDWHCTRILLYDVAKAKWYSVEVNKWIYVAETSEDTRICTFQVTELESTDLQSLPFGFGNHFCKELSNSHLLASMILLHHRSLKTPFMMGNLLLIKIFCIFLSIWCLEEVAYTWFHNNYYLDYYSSVVLIGWQSRTFADASLSAGVARLFTVPIVALHKAIYVSRFFQKRTTNPLYLATPSPKDLTAAGRKSVISRSSKGRRSTVFTFRSRMSTRISINRPFDRKFGLQRGWRLVVTLLFGPSQSRCVNVERSVFNSRVYAKLLILSLCTTLFMLTLFVSVCVIEFFTEYWRKMKSTAFIFLVAIVLDSILVTPSFILISSLISFFVLKASSKEINMINEGAKFKQPPFLDFKQYINAVTRDEYKPVLTTTLEGSRKKSKKTLSYLYALNYAIVLLALGLCMYNIGRHVTNKYNTITPATESISFPKSLLDRSSYGIDSIKNRSDVINFIHAAYIAETQTEWYSGKLIMNNRTTWQLGGYYQPLTAGNLIILLKQNKSKNYYLGTDLQAYPALFPPPCGYLSDDSQRTDPIKFVPGKTLTFTEFNPFSISSRSGESYPFKGHNLTLPLYTPDWADYYAILRKMIDAVIYRRNPCEVRALIFMWNSVNLFSQQFSAPNILFEFLPSGVVSAKVEIDAVSFHRDEWHSHLANGTLSIIFLWNICFVAILFSITTKHITQDRILNSLFLIGSITVSILYSIRWEVKFKTIREVIYDPPEVFRDLGSLFAYERAWDYTMASIIAVTMLIMTFLVLRTLGLKLMEMAPYCFICAASMFIVTALFQVSTEGFRSAVHLVDYKPLLFRVDPTIVDRPTDLSTGPLIIMFFITALLIKLNTASVIIASMYSYAEDKQAIANLSSAKTRSPERHRKRKMRLPRGFSIPVVSSDSKKAVGSTRVDDKIELMK